MAGPDKPWVQSNPPPPIVTSKRRGMEINVSARARRGAIAILGAAESCFGDRVLRVRLFASGAQLCTWMRTRVATPVVMIGRSYVVNVVLIGLSAEMPCCAPLPFTSSTCSDPVPVSTFARTFTT